MSLLDQGNARITVYPQVLGTDSDGNPQWQASEVGVEVDAMVWPLTSDEPVVHGQRSSETYRVRPVRGQPAPVGPWAQVEYAGRRWDVVAAPTRHNRGRGTRRITVTITTSEPEV